MEFTTALKKMRKSRGISQEKMAELMNMSRSNVAKLETGRIELKAVDLLSWCKITDNPDMMMILYASIDVATTIAASGAMTLMTGILNLLGGIA